MWFPPLVSPPGTLQAHLQCSHTVPVQCSPHVPHQVHRRFPARFLCDVPNRVIHRVPGVFPKCSRSVDHGFPARDTAVPLRCATHVNMRCSAPGHRGFIQGVPRWKPDTGKSSFHPGCSDLAHPGYTGWFTWGVPKVSPPGTPREHHNPKPMLDIEFGLASGVCGCRCCRRSRGLRGGRGTSCSRLGRVLFLFSTLVRIAS